MYALILENWLKVYAVQHISGYKIEFIRKYQISY
jgi:hypothetical protein